MAALEKSENVDKRTNSTNSLLESDVGVGNQEGAQDGVHDGVERAGGEGSNGEGDQTNADSPGDER